MVSDYNIANHVKYNGSNLDHYPNEVVAINSHHLVRYHCIQLPFPLKPRDMLIEGIFKKLDNGDYMLIYRSVDERDESVPKFEKSTLKPSPTRAELTSLCKLERLKFGCTKITYVAKTDIKGSVPKMVAEAGLSILVDSPRRAYQFFKRDKEVSNRKRVCGRSGKRRLTHLPSKPINLPCTTLHRTTLTHSVQLNST